MQPKQPAIVIEDESTGVKWRVGALSDSDSSDSEGEDAADKEADTYSRRPPQGRGARKKQQFRSNGRKKPAKTREREATGADGRQDTDADSDDDAVADSDHEADQDLNFDIRPG